MTGSGLKNSIRCEGSAGPPAALLRRALGWLEPVYRAAVKRRNRRFDRNPGKVIRVPVPVISVGNLTTGGTGKTPVVGWLIRLLQEAGRHPGIVSRGYGRVGSQPNDEARELALDLPDTPHLQDPDRVAAARQAISRFGVDCLVMDDGFQHRRLHRDLDLVLIDATCPFGYEHLLPRGLLREPLSSLARADAVILTRVNQVSREEVTAIRQRVIAELSAGQIAEAEFVPDQWREPGGGTHAIERLGGQRVLAFCGIGNPQAFRRALGEQLLEVIDFVAFPDHHAFDNPDLARLASRARAGGATALVCTVKDLVKIRDLEAPPVPVWALGQRTGFRAGERVLRDRVLQVF